jgi:hypothetical protein
MHIAASENSIRGLCPPPQAVQHVRLCVCRTVDNEGFVNLTPTRGLCPHKSSM